MTINPSLERSYTNNERRREMNIPELITVIGVIALLAALGIGMVIR
jgi:hypothetical protein